MPPYTWKRERKRERVPEGSCEISLWVWIYLVNRFSPLHFGLLVLIGGLFSKTKSIPIERSRRKREMLEGKGLIQDTDMPVKMQMQAMSCASEALDLFDVLDCKSIAAHIKKV